MAGLRRGGARHPDGHHEADRGAGLSDSPYGGTDGFLWRRGVATWLDEHPDPDGDENDQDGRGRPPAQKTTLYDGPGRAISTRPLSGHGPSMNILLCNGKGGTGKTTMAVLLATALRGARPGDGQTPR